MAYLDQNGAVRHDAGQFAELHSAGLIEQFGAGVNGSDSIESAGWKIANDRAAKGLDLLTGLPRQAPVGANGGFTVDEVLGFFKWALIIAAPLAVLFVAFGAALSVEGRGGFGRFAADRLFPGETLSPASRYASRGRGAQFYACQLQPHCAAFGDANPLQAGAMLAERVKAGDEAAARDLCLMPLLAETGVGTIEHARFTCKWALCARPDSAEARRIDAKLNGSLWMTIASIGQSMAGAVK